MYDAKATLPAMARHFGTSISSVRRAIKRVGLPGIRARDRGPIVSKGTGQPMLRQEDWRVRVQDEPDTLLNRLIHEGPSPERRRLMEEGRI